LEEEPLDATYTCMQDIPQRAREKKAPRRTAPYDDQMFMMMGFSWGVAMAVGM
jgi:hypothetical protein